LDEADRPWIDNYVFVHIEHLLSGAALPEEWNCQSTSWTSSPFEIQPWDRWILSSIKSE
ncbi:hypothetical protein HAX54_012724, partial [Datura stramonium]|nr:hypothetical protein [Datura stramonium]